jgi:hypothetical protein
MFWRTHHTKPDPKSMRMMPFCLWGVHKRLDLEKALLPFIFPKWELPTHRWPRVTTIWSLVLITDNFFFGPAVYKKKRSSIPFC